ncbi:hypothetical protein EW145_g3310 [Phellinidium pouzarii]|uniref:Sulfhydryl oxidase n=1 Tax=Phellinidium pouzarii TaxID=167371 RepID=A0A4S4L7S9_9AGAM|nr:hypothetical protein EW145_g3310 [Phellinidium pouzarii]
MAQAKFTRAFLGIVIAMVILTSLFMFHTPSPTHLDLQTGKLFDSDGVEAEYARARVHPSIPALPQTTLPIQGVHGGVIMGKLGNETAKQVLGRATWKLMHTMTLRFPEEPNGDERNALESYFHLQSRLYPCGECAAEFQQLLKKYPPQTSSRRSAALWLCFLHNEVNKRLEKPIFDCTHLDDTYDCGCGDEPVIIPPTSVHREAEVDGDRDELTGAGLIKGGR